VELEQTRQTAIEPTFVAGEDVSPEATRLSELTPRQWRSGTAAWLGWLFDGLDMHLYTLVAAPVVLQLIGAVSNADPGVKEKSAYIQAAFLLGWALGGSFFGRLGDILGRSRALSLTILTYAICTGLCAFAQNWWQLMLFRFIAALGIGGEWAVGASLLSETWAEGVAPWIAAMLQTGVNIGILGRRSRSGYSRSCCHPTPSATCSSSACYGALVFWIRRHVPEPEAWERERASAIERPRARDLFRGSVAPITLRTTTTCALALSGWWLFQFWQSQHLRRLSSMRAPMRER
jgi:MFS family permease